MSPMKPLGRLFGLKWYWASPRERFVYPGIHVWTGERHVRVLPLPKRRRWSA
jgi:hypothetical protein